jgi:hypothetical protein
VKGRHIDHVNLRIPADGAETARQLYGEKLGFGIEDALYQAGEKPFLGVRLSATAVLHLWPTEAFDPPTATNYDHVCTVVEEPIETVRERLEAVGVEVDAARGDRRGAVHLRRRPVRLPG